MNNEKMAHELAKRLFDLGQDSPDLIRPYRVQYKGAIYVDNEYREVDMGGMCEDACRRHFKEVLDEIDPCR